MADLSNVEAPVTEPEVRNMVKPRSTAAELRARLVAEKLNIVGPGNAARGIKAGDDFDGSNMILPVMSIKFYDKNPRTTTNPKYGQIKEGIRVRRKLGSSLTVTRRPGDAGYMLYMGGNTRLLALQELWQETGDPVFKDVPVIYYEWRSESDVISAHLIENEARGDNTFWEKANGLGTLKAEIENESGKVLSANALAEQAKQLGMDAGSRTIQRYLFALEWLAPVGSYLRTEDVLFLQPRTNAQKLLAQCFFPQEAGFYRRLLQTELDHLASCLAQGEAFDAKALAQAVDSALAQHIGVTPAQLQRMLGALAMDQHLTREALLARTAEPLPAEAAGGNPAQRESARPLSRSRKPQTPASEQAEPAVREPGASAGKETASGRVAEIGPAPTGTETAAGFLEIVQKAATRICELAFLQDCLRLDVDLPCGYYMEMPDQLIEAFDAPDVNMRRAGWQILAMMAGQFRKPIAERLPDTSRWRNTLFLDAFGPQSFLSEYQFVLQGICSDGGEVGTSISDLQMFIWHQEIGPLFRQLIDACHAWRQQEPARFASYLSAETNQFIS